MKTNFRITMKRIEHKIIHSCAPSVICVLALLKAKSLGLNFNIKFMDRNHITYYVGMTAEEFKLLANEKLDPNHYRYEIIRLNLTPKDKDLVRGDLGRFHTFINNLNFYHKQHKEMLDFAVWLEHMAYIANCRRSVKLYH